MHRLPLAEDHALQQLQLHLKTDFTAVLLLSKADEKLHVIFQIGSRSKRTEKLAFKTNKGVAEPVFKSGRSFISHINNASLLFQSCPLLLAERLTNIISVPILQDESPVGMLITGTRNSHRTFHLSEIETVQREAYNLSSSILTTLNEPIS